MWLVPVADHHITDGVSRVTPVLGWSAIWWRGAGLAVVVWVDGASGAPHVHVPDGGPVWGALPTHGAVTMLQQRMLLRGNEQAGVAPLVAMC
jgi:hypothetical protein